MYPKYLLTDFSPRLNILLAISRTHQDNSNTTLGILKRTDTQEIRANLVTKELITS